ncbi:hypothetical protein JCM10212_003786 [Sporobolomyces blumeae]
MPFGQLVIGPPGSGKTTYCWGLHQFFKALGRPILIINLDPASTSPPYPNSLSISELISLDDAMDAHRLGPNGAMLYCLEYLEANLDWLEENVERVLQGAMERSDERDDGTDSNEVDADGRPTEAKARSWTREEMYVVFDTPGQVELSTNHDSLKNVVAFLQNRMGFRLAATHLTDASHILDPAKYISVVLLALRTMLQLELPHVNVLSKIDLLSLAGELPFNLSFYTEVQDLSYLLPLLNRDPRGAGRFAELNRIVCEVVEEFGLVSFETLAVEDKESMLSLTRVIDQALGYVPPRTTSRHTPDDADFDPSHPHSHTHASQDDEQPHSHSHAHSALPPSHLSRDFALSTIQERWIDDRESYDEFERAKWEDEGRQRGERETERIRKFEEEKGRKEVEKKERERNGEAQS